MEILTIPAVTAIAQAIKMLGVPSKAMPIISIVLGIIMGLIFAGGGWIENAAIGLFIGLAASGLYDNVKPALENAGWNR